MEQGDVYMYNSETVTLDYTYTLGETSVYCCRFFLFFPFMYSTIITHKKNVNELVMTNEGPALKEGLLQTKVRQSQPLIEAMACMGLDILHGNGQTSHKRHARNNCIFIASAPKQPYVSTAFPAQL